MSWDRTTKPKRLRRKHKRLILLMALVGSVTIVSITGFWQEIANDESFTVLGYVSEMFTDEEKRVVWDGMSNEGKAILHKHASEIK